ncbi:hypothetical protein MTP99_000617 [Tenebrio molitor]|nr:hypothetical protein MTP99_000617 [Tenebrio molitor]
MISQRGRISVLALNITISLLGLGLFVLGVIWIETELEYERATQKQFIYVGAILMAIGLVLGITTTIGCYAAIAKKRFLLDLNAFLFLLLFLVYADYGIIAFQLNDKSSPYMKDFGKELSDIFDKPKEDWKRFFDYIQQKFQCCGVEGFQDYTRFRKRTPLKSCCADQESECAIPTYKRGCVEPFGDYIAQNFVVSGAVSFVIAILTLFASAFTYVVKKKQPSEEVLANDEL